MRSKRIQTRRCAVVNTPGSLSWSSSWGRVRSCALLPSDGVSRSRAQVIQPRRAACKLGLDVAGAAGIHVFTTETGTPAEEQEPERGKKLPFFAAECRFGFLLIISSPPLCFF